MPYDNIGCQLHFNGGSRLRSSGAIHYEMMSATESIEYDWAIRGTDNENAKGMSSTIYGQSYNEFKLVAEII